MVKPPGGLKCSIPGRYLGVLYLGVLYLGMPYLGMPYLGMPYLGGVR
jgi:hypothetical protein